MRKTLNHRHQWLFLLIAAILFLHAPRSLFAVASLPAQPDRFKITLMKVELRKGKDKYIPFADGPFVFEALLSDPTTRIATIPVGKRPVPGATYTGIRLTFLGAFEVQWSLLDGESFYYTDAHNDGIFYKTKMLKDLEAVTMRNLVVAVPSLVNMQVILMPGGKRYKELLKASRVEVLKKGLLRTTVNAPLNISGYGPQMLDIDLTNAVRVVYDDITVKDRPVRVLYPAVPSFGVSVRVG